MVPSDADEVTQYVLPWGEGRPECSFPSPEGPTWEPLSVRRHLGLVLCQAPSEGEDGKGLGPVVSRWLKGSVLNRPPPARERRGEEAREAQGPDGLDLLWLL